MELEPGPSKPSPPLPVPPRVLVVLNGGSVCRLGFESTADTWPAGVCGLRAEHTSLSFAVQSSIELTGVNSEKQILLINLENTFCELIAPLKHTGVPFQCLPWC